MIQQQNKISKQSDICDGFVATTALLLVSFGMLAIMTATLASVISYADTVERREVRIQKNLNQKACLDSIALMKVKDYFLQGKVSLPEFECAIDII